MLEKKLIEKVIQSQSKQKSTKANFLEFFTGSGLVAKGLQPYFTAALANDICPKKAAVYTL